MKKVVIKGPLLSKSGYGTHARQVFKWLLNRGNQIVCDVTPWGITPWHIDPSSLDGLVGEVMKRTSPSLDGVEASIQIQLPNEWNPNLTQVNIGVTAGIETDKAVPSWGEACNRMTRVIVPSNFSKSGLVAAGANPEKIIVVPESFSESIQKGQNGPSVELNLDDVDTPFNFLLFGQITSRDPETDRKNILYTVKWFCEEFSGDKNVGLIIKSNLGTNCVFHRHQLKDFFTNLVKEVRKGDFPRIHLLNGDMSDLECAALLKHPKVSAMISFTRGEGWGLPMIDAAASGLPIIATGWSGHMDFLGVGKFSKVSHELVKINHAKMDKNLFLEGSRWANPSEADAKKRMRKMFESPNPPKEWAIELQNKVHEKFSFESVKNIYETNLGGML